MVGSINGGSPQGMYVQQVRRQVWRDEMLAQFLEKARQVTPEVPALPGPDMAQPAKGSILDVMV